MFTKFLAIQISQSIAKNWNTYCENSEIYFKHIKNANVGKNN